MKGARWRARYRAMQPGCRACRGAHRSPMSSGGGGGWLGRAAGAGGWQRRRGKGKGLPSGGGGGFSKGSRAGKQKGGAKGGRNSAGAKKQAWRPRGPAGARRAFLGWWGLVVGSDHNYCGLYKPLP